MSTKPVITDKDRVKFVVVPLSTPIDDILITKWIGIRSAQKFIDAGINTLGDLEDILTFTINPTGYTPEQFRDKVRNFLVTVGISKSAKIAIIELMCTDLDC
jgi:hypothetical protein